MIELFTLGRAAIRRDGEELRGVLKHRQKFALLAYLGVEGRVTRDRLLAVFWPEREEERARHSLSQALYALRQELGEDWVQIEGDEVAPAPDTCTVDAVLLAAAAEREDWPTVIELYRGHFLDQFALPGSQEFEDWQSTTRTRLIRLARQAFRAVVEARIAKGELQEALSVAMRWASLEPVGDGAQHTLIGLLAQTGQRATALQQFEAYRSRLASELEVEPLAYTVALVEQIRSGTQLEFRPLGMVETSAPAVERPTAAAPPPSVPVPAPEVKDPFAFLRELRKRRVFHVGAAYLAVAWLALQAASTLVEQAIFPPLVFQILLFFLLVGFPISILLAWAHERPQAAAAAPAVERAVWRLPAWWNRVRGTQVLLTLGVLVIAVVLFWRLFYNKPRPPQSFTGASTVLVMPIDITAGAVSELAPNAVELHRLLLNSIEWMPGLHAVDGSPLLPADQSWRSRDFAELIGGSAGQGASYLLAGEILGAANGPRLSVYLYSVANVERIERRDAGGDESMSEAVERIAFELARVVADRENMDLGVHEHAAAATTSPRAFANLLQGQANFSRRDFEGAVRGYQRAIQADSSYALAYHRLSVASNFRHDDARAYAAVETALRRRAEFGPRWLELLQAQRYYAARKPDSAIVAFQVTVLDYPENIDGWFGLGEAMLHLGGFAGYAPGDAQVPFSRVVALDSAFAPIYYHLFDLALYQGDSIGAAQYLRRVDDRHRPSREVAFSLKWSPGAQPLPALAEAERYDISELFALFAHNAFDLRLADTIATFLIGPDRTPDDRIRGAQYRLLALAGQGRWEEALAAWDAVAANQQFDRWLVHAQLAGYPTGQRVDPMFAWARALSERGLSPDFQRDITDESRQAFRALVHRATLSGDSVEVLALLDRLDRRTACGSGVPCDEMTILDPMPIALQASLRSRLALLAGDSARAIQDLRNSLARVGQPGAMTFYPLVAMAPQRLLLAELLINRGDQKGARTWLDSFSNLWQSVGDVLYIRRVEELRRRFSN